MIRQATIKSSTFSISSQCRCDAKYGIFVSQDSWNAFQYNGKLQALSDLLIPHPISKVGKGELSDDYYLINISDQVPGDGIVDENNVIIADTLNSDKTILSDCDILVSKLGMTRGYIYLKPKTKSSLIGSSEFIPYKLRDNTNGLFYLYLLLMPQMRNAYRCLETGKTPSHKRVNPTEFLKICVPVLKKDLIEKANKKIQAILNEILVFNSQRVDSQIIIDEVFSRHFSLDPNLRNKLHKGMTFGTQSSTNTQFSMFTTSINTFSNYFGLRFSARSHTSIIDNILNILRANGVLKIGEIITDIHNGKKPIYSSEEEIAVIKTTNISNNGISLNEVEYVTEKQYNDTPDAQILPGDILICNIGKCSLGKVDICDSNNHFFAATETMIVRVDKEKYDPYFLLYYLRSVFGTAQFEREYTGTTNQIHISPDNVRSFIVPNISIEVQKMIVSEIQSRITSQNEISLQVSKLRQDINQVILDAITD